MVWRARESAPLDINTPTALQAPFCCGDSVPGQGKSKGETVLIVLFCGPLPGVPSLRFA